MTRPLVPVIGGTAVVCCIHDRVKREVNTEADVAALGLAVGQVYDPQQHKIHKCACCENLFVDPTDIPKYCVICSKIPTHMQMAPLDEPKGVVYE